MSLVQVALEVTPSLYNKYEPACVYSQHVAIEAIHSFDSINREMDEHVPVLS